MQFWPPDDEHMCSKHVEAYNILIVKQKFCASSWLNTEINILRCTVSNSSKKKMGKLLSTVRRKNIKYYKKQIFFCTFYCKFCQPKLSLKVILFITGIVEIIFTVVQQPPPPPPNVLGPSHYLGFTITLNGTPQSVGLLWTSDKPVAETSTWQHKTLITDRHVSGGGD